MWTYGHISTGQPQLRHFVMDTYQCKDCSKILKKNNMKRHAAEVHGEGRSELLYCDTCEYGTNRQRDLERHIINVHHSNRPQKGGETLNKSSREGGEKRRSATTQPTPTKKKLIIKIKPPGAPSALADYLPESETATNEAEESRRRALPRIPLLPTPHTDVMGEYVREEGAQNKLPEETATPVATREPEPPAHQGNFTASTPSASIESGLDAVSADDTPVKSASTQDNATQPPSEPTRRSSKDARSRHRHKSTQNTGTNTTTIHTGDSESQTSETRRRISLDTYRDCSTHNVEITYSRLSTRVVVQNATGDWRNSIRDLHALMEHKIPSQDPVDINLRLDPYQSSTATSFDTESSEMAGTGYGTIHASDNSARTQTDYPADEHPQYEEYK